MIEITVRIIFSLLVVLLLMWALARVARRPLAGRTGGALAVLARQHLTRGSSVAVVRLGDRALVLGVTDQQITLLAETDPAVLTVAVPAGGEVRESLSVAELTGADAPGGRPAPGGFAGSALSPATWRQAAAAVRRARRA